MKKLFFLFTLISACSFAFGQSNDLQAKYLYSKAEDSYTKNQFADAINLCEQAAEKLGQTNQKILFLELESYAALLNKNPDDSLLQDIDKIDNNLDLYLNKLSKSADDEKIIAVMKFKELWAAHKTTALAVSSYYDQHLGLTFKDSYYPETYGKKIDRYWEITAISDGPFKNIQGNITNINSLKSNSLPPLSVGFLVDCLNAYTGLTGIDDDWMSLKSRNDDITISSTEIKTKINTWLKGLVASKHQFRTINIVLWGRYAETNKKYYISYEVALPPLYK